MQRSAKIPDIFGIFHRNIEGDEALLQLVKRRFEAAGLGAELYPGTPLEAEWEWQFVPREPARHSVHLPRHLDLLSAAQCGEILSFARPLAGRARGLVVHDRLTWSARMNDLLAAARELNRSLLSIPNGPMVYLEYAAGLPLSVFIEIASRLREMERVSVCLDTGHVALFACHERFRALCPGIDFWGLAQDPVTLTSVLPELQKSMDQAREDLQSIAQSLVELGRPMHFHLHDGHPLSLWSYYGVRDHLSFRDQVPVPTEVEPSGYLPTLIGEAGLRRLVKTILSNLASDQVSLTLEIHHTRRAMRSSLGEHGDLFGHWRDWTHAELTNGWLDVLLENARLLQLACRLGTDDSGSPENV